MGINDLKLYTNLKDLVPKLQGATLKYRVLQYVVISSTTCFIVHLNKLS
jgi:hypothetical protein